MTGHAQTTDTKTKKRPPERSARARKAIAETQRAASVFNDCAFASAEPRINGPFSPSEIADGALADCFEQYEAVKAALNAPYYVNDPAAHQRADAFAISMRDDIRRGVIAAVMAVREVK